MNKIIIVGHPQSDLERVEDLLLTCGMSQAIPSRREGLTPAQISQTLIKAHGAVPVQHVSSPVELQQITVAPVWQGLALDLMLANMDAPLWGWADTQAVYLLEFWKNQDPQTMFVLVFDAPQSALTRYAIEQLESEPEMLQAQVNGWIAYNAALLNFHLRNTDRSLLVHAEQVQTSAPHYLQQLSAHMDAALRLPSVPNSQLSVTADATALDGITLCDKAQNGAQQTLRGNHLAEWLAQQLLEEQPEAADLYAQLQTAASMPLRTQEQPVAIADGLLNQRYQAWSAFVSQQATMQQSIARLAQLDKTLHDKEMQLHASHDQIEKLHKDIQSKAKDQETLLNSSLSVQQSYEQEKELLLIQLSQVQEELESSYLTIEDQTKKINELHKFECSFEELKENFEDLKKNNIDNYKEENELLLVQLHQLQSELENSHLKIKDQSKLIEELEKFKISSEKLEKKSQEISADNISIDLKEENDLLLIQLNQVQEELERFYIERNCDGKGIIAKNSVYSGAPERVKQQLSYRLGATMIAQSRSLGGWLCMPFTLRAEAQRFKQDQAKRGDIKLPPITQYSDAYEAEKIKQHLSYRLGARMIANSKSFGGWVAMPWALLKEVKTFQKKRQSSARDVK